jgi:predicted DNA-binding antitoxin AbrB/MazE fold protein
MMSISIEAIYESGVLKPLSPLPGLEEHEKVILIVERAAVCFCEIGGFATKTASFGSS